LQRAEIFRIERFEKAGGFEMIATLQSSASRSASIVRCAIYTRKSNEDGLDQAFNSLHAQRAMCESYIASFTSEGWVALPTDYSDAGITGGTLERSGLQKLLGDIEAGRVDVVVIYRLDRLSRSLHHFLDMMEVFDNHKVSFASVTERIDTTSSAGRLFLNMILSFAQFEREVAAERIRDKIASAKRKGKYVGGRPLLGYDVDREKMRLVVNPEEAQLVRHIFQRFCRVGSCMKVAQELNAAGQKMKAWTSRKGRAMGGGTWLKTDVHHLLTNRRYIGLVSHKNETFTGEHEAIIDRKTWDRVQGILSANRTCRGSQTRKTTAALLKGILRCGCCDAAMVPTYTTRKGKRYHYYLCHVAGKTGRASCEINSVAAGPIEGAVFTYLKDMFVDPDMVARTFRATSSERDVAAALQALEPLWEELFPAEKERIVRLLVDTITVRPDGLTIRLRPTGLITLASELALDTADHSELGETIV
jgi:DNA invertase Pin-like site-specific DNA recombinase